MESDRAGTVTKQIELGLESSMVVGRYKEMGSETEEPEEGGTMEGEFTETEAMGAIASGNFGNSVFNVERGIPVTESLYTQVFAPKYLAGYCFTNKTGVKTYLATGTITWNLAWTEGEGEEAVARTAVQTVTYSAPVERVYSYWEISNLDVYRLANATVNNGAFPAGSVTMAPNGYAAPTVSYTHDAGVDAHVRQPEEIGQVLDLGTMSYGGPVPPIFDATALLNGRVKECRVKNDRLLFDGQTVMSDTECRKATVAPVPVETEPGMVPAGTLYAAGLVIPATRANGDYGSSGSVAYSRIAGVNSNRPAVMMLQVEAINPVTVHTPVVCVPTAEDKRELCQLTSPDPSRTELVLDTAFHLSLPTVGEHRDIPGYGVRDYGKYTAARQVKFPFDVYKGTGSEIFVPAETWTEVGTDTAFYLPPWVEEGLYSLSFRSVALNAAANGGTNLTETGANLSVSDYTAVNHVRAEVSGRLYGFRVYDISDDDNWGEVFWDRNGVPTGFHYSVGVCDEFGRPGGQNAKFTLPVLNGSHPYYKNLGALKTGYTFRYQVDTIGGYEDAADFLKITPTFYYVNGENGRRRAVDLYYSETFETTGKRELLVKVGSERDLRNRHTMKNVECFTFGDVRIPEDLVNCRKPDISADFSLAGKTEPEVAAHLQTWHGEYYLPQEIHVCPKNFNLKKWTKEHGALDYTEDFWLKNGYVIVNFDIGTVQDGVPHLSYSNRENAVKGYCNMWKMEGGVSRKTDFDGVNYKIQDGDVIFYYTDKSIRDDYQSSVVY